jgi:hypothetical protein
VITIQAQLGSSRPGKLRQILDRGSVTVNRNVQGYKYHPYQRTKCVTYAPVGRLADPPCLGPDLHLTVPCNSGAQSKDLLHLPHGRAIPLRFFSKLLTECRECRRWFHMRVVKCGSKRKCAGFPIISFWKSPWNGFRRKLLSAGMIELGTSNTGEAPDATHSLPIAWRLAGGGSACQSLGNFDSSTRVISAESIRTSITTY